MTDKHSHNLVWSSGAYERIPQPPSDELTEHQRALLELLRRDVLAGKVTEDERKAR
jgi:hypothetical protein